MGDIPESLEERLERVISSSHDPMYGKVPAGKYVGDMHVHSGFSKDVPPLEPYSPLAKMVLALERGMHYFTLTDHNTYDGNLELIEQLSGMGELGKEALKRFIPGVEIDVYIKSVGQVIHTNVYGLNEEQWEKIHTFYDPEFSASSMFKQVDGIEELADYLKSEGLLFAFNHPFWKPMPKGKKQSFLRRVIPGLSEIKKDHYSLVSLGLLFSEFPVIEINGTRIQPLNDLAEYFALQHAKPLIGGSDDHYTETLGNCYTIARGETWQEFLEEIREGRAQVMRNDLDEAQAKKKAHHVVGVYFGGECDLAEYLGKLVNREWGFVIKKIFSLWQPRWLKYVHNHLTKLGAKGYLQTQYSCLPSSWQEAIWFGRKTPIREALERLKREN